MPLPENLRYLMKVRGLSAPELAERLGRSQSVVYGWLRGAHTPARTTLKKLAECFDVPPRALLETDLAGESERPRSTRLTPADPMRLLLQMLRSLRASGNDEVRDFGPVVVLSGRAKEVFDELRSVEATLERLAREKASATEMEPETEREPETEGEIEGVGGPPEEVRRMADPPEGVRQPLTGVEGGLVAGEPFREDSPVAEKLTERAAPPD